MSTSTSTPVQTLRLVPHGTFLGMKDGMASYAFNMSGDGMVQVDQDNNVVARKPVVYAIPQRPVGV